MKRVLIILLTVSVLFLGSCKKDTIVTMDAAVQHIPADATQVTVVRVPSLMKKIDFNDLKKMDFYQSMIKEAGNRDELSAKILEDPTESGLNMNQNFYIITDVDPINMNDMLNGMMMNIADPAKFANLVKMSPLSAGAKKMSGYQYTKDGEKFLAWNDDIALVGQYTGTLEARLEKIFNLSEGSSVLGSSSFEKVGSSTNDFSFWLSTDNIANNPQASMGSAMLGYSADDLKGNYINGGANFEDKKMTIDLEFLLKKVIATDLSMPFKSNVSTDFSAYIPNENLSSVFTFGFDLKGLNQLLKEKNAQGLLAQQMGLDRMGVTLDELVDAIDGDMMLATQKVGSDGKPAGIFSMTINEKKFAPYLANFISSGLIADKGNGVYIIKDQSVAQNFHNSFEGAGVANQPYAVLKDGKIFVTSDPALLEGIKNGGLAKGKRIDKGLYKEISRGFLGGKGFPDKMKEFVGDDFEGMNIESFVLSVEDGNAKLELVSKDDGNFLKSMIERNQK